MTHICPARLCKRQVPDRHLLCGPHWFMVPAVLRSGVWDAYHGAGVGSLELTRAQVAAVDAVNAKMTP